MSSTINNYEIFNCVLSGISIESIMRAMQESNERSRDVILPIVEHYPIEPLPPREKESNTNDEDAATSSDKKGQTICDNLEILKPKVTKSITIPLVYVYTELSKKKIEVPKLLPCPSCGNGHMVKNPSSAGALILSVQDVNNDPSTFQSSLHVQIQCLFCGATSAAYHVRSIVDLIETLNRNVPEHYHRREFSRDVMLLLEKSINDMVIAIQNEDSSGYRQFFEKEYLWLLFVAAEEKWNIYLDREEIYHTIQYDERLEKRAKMAGMICRPKQG